MDRGRCLLDALIFAPLVAAALAGVVGSRGEDAAATERNIPPRGRFDHLRPRHAVEDRDNIA